MSKNARINVIRQLELLFDPKPLSLDAFIKERLELIKRNPRFPIVKEKSLYLESMNLISGELQNTMCQMCEDGRGIIVECRRVEGYFKGGCGNHARQGRHNDCEIRDENVPFEDAVEEQLPEVVTRSGRVSKCVLPGK